MEDQQKHPLVHNPEVNRNADQDGHASSTPSSGSINGHLPIAPYSRGSSSRFHRYSPEEKFSKIVEQIKSIYGKKEDSLDSIFGACANVMLEHMADAFTVDLVEDDGTIRRYITRHIDPEKEALLAKVREDFGLSRTGSYGYTRVIKTGKPQFFQGVTPQLLERIYPDEAARDVIKSVTLRSFLCTPLVCRGRTLGAITLKMTERSNVLTIEDLRIMEEIASILAKCIDERV